VEGNLPHELVKFASAAWVAPRDVLGFSDPAGWHDSEKK